MKIGELSRRTKVSIRSLRYYEQQGLIAPDRRENGYREYNPFSVEQVETIKFYLDLGMTTAEISGFLQCVLKNKEAFCNEIMPIYQKKLDDVNRQIELLTRIKTNLEQRIHSIQSENPKWMEDSQNER